MDGNGPENDRREQNVTQNRTKEGRFVVGWQGGPGRPAGSRSKLSETFLQTLAADFATHGASVIEQVRRERPHHYLSVCASLVPKELHVERTSQLGELSDAELQLVEDVLTAQRARLVQQIEPAPETSLENK
jgi:hypothetical protein